MESLRKKKTWSKRIIKVFKIGIYLEEIRVQKEKNDVIKEDRKRKERKMTVYECVVGLRERKKSSIGKRREG